MQSSLVMKKLFTLSFIIICLFAGNMFAQNDYQSYLNTQNKGVVYNKEVTVDIRTHTNGFLALAANFGTIKTYYKTKYYHFEIGEIKHNKEYRTRDLAPSNNGRIASSFVYGKQNNFYVVRGGLGTKKYITDKARQKGLAIGINYEYGPALGLVKPYYVNINSDVSSGVRAIKYTPETATEFLNYNRIAGHAGFTKGLDELSVVPGIQGKFGLLLDWGAFDEFVKAVEIGIMADVFFRTIPIMVDNISIDDPTAVTPTVIDITPENVRNRPFFVNLYISLQLGKRSQ